MKSKKSITTSTGSKATCHIPDELYSKTCKIFRLGALFSEEQAKDILAFLEKHDFIKMRELSSIDEVHINLIIDRPEKKGGRKR